jgi:ABC-2 type transport system ATP-binding protein
MIVVAEGLCKNFGRFTAVDDVSFAIEPGRFTGLIGPNGAGKTTIIHMLLGLITPDAGEIRLFGQIMRGHDPAILQRINFTSPYANFPGRLTVMENLLILARLYQVARPKRIIADLLAEFDIVHLAERPVTGLSSGEITRMALCKAFLNNPELLLLDEPTAYMDPFIAERTRATLMSLQQRRGTTILLTSHNMREVECVCDEVVLLARGRVLASGAPLAVTRAVLREERAVPALGEVFASIAFAR